MNKSQDFILYFIRNDQSFVLCEPKGICKQCYGYHTQETYYEKSQNSVIHFKISNSRDDWR